MLPTREVDAGELATSVESVVNPDEHVAVGPTNRRTWLGGVDRLSSVNGVAVVVVVVPEPVEAVVVSFVLRLASAFLSAVGAG